MPLTRKVTFKTSVQKWGRFRVPRVVRWQFKLEASEVLKVTVGPVSLIGVRESFFGRMRRDGCVTVPAVVMALLKKDQSSLEGYALEVTLEPA